MKLARSALIMIAAFGGITAAGLATDEPNFHALAAPTEISILESDELRQKLQLTDQQQTQLQAVLNEGKARFLTAKARYDARPDAIKRGPYQQRRDQQLQNSLSDLLNDEQHQLFHQMLTLRFQSPVQASAAFQYDLQLTDQQHAQLHQLETQWVLHALQQVPCDYRYQRHTETRDLRSVGLLKTYGAAVAQAAWQFAPRRDEQWNRILSPQQAKRWKQREMQWVFQLMRFDALLLDLEPARSNGVLPATGTWIDNNVPYITSPAAALQWSEQQQADLRNLIRPVRFGMQPLPSDSKQRTAVMQERQQQELDCMRNIEQIMTAAQRAIFWDLIGEPARSNRFLLRMKANSEAVSAESRERE